MRRCTRPPTACALVVRSFLASSRRRVSLVVGRRQRRSSGLSRQATKSATFAKRGDSWAPCQCARTAQRLAHSLRRSATPRYSARPQFGPQRKTAVNQKSPAKNSSQDFFVTTRLLHFKSADINLAISNTREARATLIERWRITATARINSRTAG